MRPPQNSSQIYAYVVYTIQVYTTTILITDIILHEVPHNTNC